MLATRNHSISCSIISNRRGIQSERRRILSVNFSWDGLARSTPAGPRRASLRHHGSFDGAEGARGVTPGTAGQPHGPFPPGHLRNHQAMNSSIRNDQRGTFAGRRFVRRVFATCRSARCRIASGVPGTRRALPSACPRRPDPGADSSGRLALIAWFDMTYLGGDPSRSGPCHRSGFRPRRAGRAQPKPPNRSGRKRTSRRDRGDGPGVGHLGSRDGYDGITPDPAAAGPRGASSSSPSADIRSDRPSAGASAGASSA